MPYKFWNGRLVGVPYAFFMFIAALWRLFIRKVVSRIKSYNLGGNNCALIGKHFVVRFPNNIIFGKNVMIDDNVHIVTEDSKSQIVIEDGVSISTNVVIDYTGGVSIKKTAHIASQSYIMTHSHGYDYKNPPIGTPLIVGEHAFIGARSTILSGCNYIGSNAVVGAGSVVTKDVPDNTIVAGNPARVIKTLE